MKKPLSYSIISLIIPVLIFICTCVKKVDKENTAQTDFYKFAPELEEDDLRLLAHGNNTFSFNLYMKLQSNGENLFFSPMSISTALAMVYAGAKGNTAKEISDTFNFISDKNRLNHAYRSFMMRLNEEGRGYSLHMANRLWGQKGYKFLDEYLRTTDYFYGAKLAIVDFKKESERARVISMIFPFAKSLRGSGTT